MNSIEIALDIEELLDILYLYLSNVEAAEFSMSIKRPFSYSLMQKLIMDAKKLKTKCHTHAANIDCYYCSHNYCYDCSFICEQCFVENNPRVGMCISCSHEQDTACNICDLSYCGDHLDKCHANEYCKGHICQGCIKNIEINMCSICYKVSCCNNEDKICIKCMAYIKS
jgi:hypothetical protein